MRTRVTLRDVARAAGVSTGTASRAMGGRGRVSAATVEHVNAVAQRLGYTPDAIGRSLRRGSTSTVGMVVPHLQNPFFAELVRAVESVLHEEGYQLIIADSSADVAQEADRLRLLIARHVDGIVVVPAWYEASAPAVAAAAAELPLVQIDRRAGDQVADFVGVDNARGMLRIVQHVAENGARSVLFIGADDATSPGRERLAAFRRAAEACELDVVGEYRHQFTYETGIRAVRKWAQMPDAIVCADDIIALGAIGELGRSRTTSDGLPQITGFDGTLLATIIEPALTTMRQPLDDIAREAVLALIARIGESEEAPLIDHLLSPDLQVGGTTWPRGAEDAARPRTSRPPGAGPRLRSIL